MKVYMRLITIFTFGFVLTSCAGSGVNAPSEDSNINTNADDTVSDSDIIAPSIPGGLHTTEIPTTASVSLSWDKSTDNVGVSGYRIYRNNSSIATVASSSYIDTAVSANSSYQYSIEAFDAANNSAMSDVLTITTPALVNSQIQLTPISYNCSDSDIHCVDDTGGANQEFPSIQEAVNIATAGDTVIVHNGTYTGFTVSTSGSSDSNRIVITGNGNNVLINSGGSSEGRVLVSNSDYVTIEGLTIEGASSLCLAARDASSGNPMVGVNFQFNTVRNCGSSNIYMSQASYSLILGNTTYGSIASHGIYLSNAGSDHTIIRGNRSYNNSKNGLHFNGDSSNGGDGLHSHIVIDSNYFYNNAQSGVDADGLYDSLFVNNLIYDNSRHGIRGFRIDASAGVGRLNFVNNTLVNNGSWGVKLTDDIGDHVFFNNIIMNNAGGCIASGHSNLVSDKNIYDSSCGFSQDGESTTISYLNWVTIYSDTSVQSSINTVLSNASADDYTLNSNSPAIDAGSSSFGGVSAPNVDIDSASRPNGSGIDIGAYEN